MKRWALVVVGMYMLILLVLTSFGPAVFFLYAGRWRRRHPAPAGEAEGCV